MVIASDPPGIFYIKGKDAMTDKTFEERLDELCTRKLASYTLTEICKAVIYNPLDLDVTWAQVGPLIHALDCRARRGECTLIEALTPFRRLSPQSGSET